MPKRDFLRVYDITASELNEIILKAISYKHQAKRCSELLKCKSIGLYFEKPSTRTRVSFEVATYQLGGQAILLNPSELQINRGESIADTAKVLSRYLDAMMMRTYSHDLIVEFAKHFEHPVINGLSDKHHPCQALADMMTIKEQKPNNTSLKLAYIGDGNNVAHSLLEACSHLNIHISIACPQGYEPDSEVTSEIKGTFEILHDPVKAIKNADVVYTDVWVSMGQEHEAQRKLALFKPYQINAKLLRQAKSDAIVMHCLPAHRGQEITDEVIDSPQSVVITQAENRLHTTKALLDFLLSQKD